MISTVSKESAPKSTNLESAATASRSVPSCSEMMPLTLSRVSEDCSCARRKKNTGREKSVVRRSVSFFRELYPKPRKKNKREFEREKKTYRSGVDGEAGASLGGNSGGLEVNLLRFKSASVKERREESQCVSIADVKKKRDDPTREKDNEKKKGGDCANSKLRSWPLSSTSARARGSLSLSRAPAGKTRAPRKK